ncbi:putative thioesterase [Thermosipho japonicus]|uniref:Putative thioesterase n=1 Tax=Thermosipho japonicus TaxID=90323 RepID=A0A841GUN3_9BACT|nr:putative thioesterase [Thermosipho japonicus]
MKDLWRKIEGISKTIDFTPDESYLWDEDDEMRNYHFVSSSSLARVAFKLGADMVKDFLPEDLISVVSEFTVKHYMPVVIGAKLVVGVRVKSVDGNLINFSGLITKDNKKVAEVEFTRVIVSRNYLRRKAVEETT